MRQRKKKMRKLFGALTAVMTVAALTVPLLAQPAQANHGTLTLDVPQEYQEHFTGEPSTFTATLSGPNPGPEPINIDFEHEAGNNNIDGNTPTSPDLTCDIPAGQDSCSQSYTGTRQANGANCCPRDRWRIWIDHDKVQTTVEADRGTQSQQAEGTTASRKDCEQDPRRENCGDVSYGTGPTGAGATAYQPGTGGTDCPGQGPAPSREPDCTDVVEVDYNNRPGTPATLDCDDRSGSQSQDTERETNPSSSDASVSGEEYRCRVLNQFGSGMNEQNVFAEVENDVNDPDTPSSASYTSPDYSCVTTFDEQGIPLLEDSGVCYITITQQKGQLGTAEVCFWTGTTSEGATLCADEPTGEGQSPDGTDAGNDRADQTEKTWENVSTFTLDCAPETDTNPAGQAHSITCTPTSRTSGRAVSGVQLRMEITGSGDPDMSNTPQNPDQSCRTNDQGQCTFNHTSASSGNTTYRVWIDDETTETPRPPEGVDNDVDRTEGQDESTSAGEFEEPDGTDVVTKTWGAAPATLTMIPENDSAPVGDCNPFTITLSSGSGQSTAPSQGATIDVEQRHERAAGQNDVAGDEPTVEFCTPTSGPNPSDVDTTRGDLGPNSAQENDRETPDNKGTAGGETVRTTDANGQVTIGIKVTPGQGSDGSGTVTVEAFFDSNNNDDPDTSEPKDTSGKVWQAAGSSEGRTITCAPDSATNAINTDHTVTCSVRGRSGQPVQGEGVTWTETGPGEFKGTPEATTDANGQAKATVTSSETGAQTITATLTDDTGAGEPDDVDECDRPANDPTQGAPAGNCSDSVTKTWQEEAPPQCDDGQDNDGDGQTDFPDDPECESAEDNDESQGTCPGHENDPRNHIVGTPGNDELNGTSDGDVICGLGGDDTITGGGGDDLILGGGGNDDLRGQGGNDEIRGGGGKDAIRGNAGSDRLVGGSQNDIILGNVGEDTLVGNSGEDILRGGKDADEVRGGRHDDTLQGGRGGDLLRGGKGRDTLRGAGGHDTIRGGGGDDSLRGGRGNDKLNGGSGTDSCVGGPGRDRRNNCEG